MYGKKEYDLSAPPPQWIGPHPERKQSVLVGILSITTLLSLVFVPVHGKAATTSLEAILAQGAHQATQICSSTGGSPIGTFTFSSKECLQSGSTQSGPGTGSLSGETRAKTTYGISTPSKLALSVFAKAEANVSADFQGLYDYQSQATNTFLDQITITGGDPGLLGILEVVLHVFGQITVDGNGASDSASLKITVSSPFGTDNMEFISPMNINGPLIFEVPFKFDMAGEFKILVEAFAGQNVNGPFNATQTVDFENTVTLDWVRVKDIPDGEVISDTGFVYPEAPASSGSQSNSLPTVNIDNPTDGDSFVKTEPVSFIGSGSDDEDGTLTGASLSWTSSLDGSLGTGSNLNSSLSEGNHIITLIATDSQGSTGRDSVSINVTLPEPGGGGSPVSSVTLVADKPSPALLATVEGEGVQFAGTATGGSGSYEYQFWLRDPAGNVGVVQAYGNGPTFHWTTPSVGQWAVAVGARNLGSSVIFEADTSIPFEVTSDPPVTAVSLSADPMSPALLATVEGGGVQFTGTATGGSGSYEYQFWLRDPAGNVGVVQAYGNGPTFHWTTPSVGQWAVAVGARNQGSSVIFEADTSIPFEITSP